MGFRRLSALLGLLAAAALAQPACAQSTGTFTAILARGPCSGVALRADFAANNSQGLYCEHGQRYGSFLAMPGASFTRASVGTASDGAGNVLSFASGQLRITDQGLLVEEGRTNLALQSQTLDVGTVWFPTAASVAPNADTAPDGTVTADTLVENSATAQHYVTQGFTKAASATAYFASVFVKQSGAARNLAFQVNDGAGNGFSVIVDPTSGAVLSGPSFFGTGFSGGTVSSAPTARGYLRVAVAFTSNAATSLGLILQSTNGTTVSYLGDGVSGLLLWGMQLESGGFASSYIPTAGAAVARASDVASIGGLTTYLAAPFWVKTTFNFSGVSASNLPNVIHIDDGTNTNRIRLFRNDADGTMEINTDVTTTQSNLIMASISVGVGQRVGFALGGLSSRAALNGSAIVSGSDAAIPVLNTVRFGPNSGGAVLDARYIGKLVIFPGVPLDGQLQGP